MTREIKFRAWNKQDNCFEVNDIFLSLGMGSENGLIYRGNIRQDNNFILSQFTGLKDKNGKEVFEGDVIKFRSHPNPTEIATVVYDENSARFMANYKDSTGWHSFQHFNLIEVIGNIYQNPELLK